jgi:hypothetical protein
MKISQNAIDEDLFFHVVSHPNTSLALYVIDIINTLFYTSV